MELWFTEKQTPDLGITCKVSRTLYTQKTEYQDLAVIDTKQFGRMLVLDGTVQTTVEDEFCYHELISHVALFTHPNPEYVAVIGGGDGGVIREILKHNSVKKAYLIEIDKYVVEASKKYFPEISVALDDPRSEVIITDGIKYVAENKNKFDVVIVDSTDPVGPAVGLFQEEFYRSIFECLKDDGIFVAQTESPFFNKDLIRSVFSTVKGIFPITRLYAGFVPTYPSGAWTFTLGSKTYDPLEVDISKIEDIPTKYYNKQVHKALFALPNFVNDIIK
ncbi:polyamine aminopropyltransferase [Caldicellulosiruptoraceae bacterium PP1]